MSAPPVRLTANTPAANAATCTRGCAVVARNSAGPIVPGFSES